MNPRIAPITPSQSAHATNQKIYCSTPATSVINTPTGRNEFFKGFTVPSIYGQTQPSFNAELSHSAATSICLARVFQRVERWSARSNASHHRTQSRGSLSCRCCVAKLLTRRNARSRLIQDQSSEIRCCYRQRIFRLACSRRTNRHRTS